MAPGTRLAVTSEGHGVFKGARRKTVSLKTAVSQGEEEIGRVAWSIARGRRRSEAASVDWWRARVLGVMLCVGTLRPSSSDCDEMIRRSKLGANYYTGSLMRVGEGQKKATYCMQDDDNRAARFPVPAACPFRRTLRQSFQHRTSILNEKTRVGRYHKQGHAFGLHMVCTT